MNFFLSSASRILTIFLLGAGLLVLPSQTAAAQDAPSLLQNLRNDLQSNDPVQREHALMDVISLATCGDACTIIFRSIDEKKLTIANETGTGHVVELNALIPDLIDVYRSGPADGHRLIALSALLNIGNEAALERLIDEGARQSKETNRMTQRSLAAFYLEKYPELLDQTMKTKRLSMDDVHRAKALRVRQMKNQEGG
jgi:hypothetical protein